MAADIQPTEATGTAKRDAPEPDEAETISVRFTLPRWVLSEAGLNPHSLDDVAREAFLVNLYREDTISYYQLGKALGLSRLEVLDVLKRHQVSFGISAEEMREQAEALREGLARAKAR